VDKDEFDELTVALGRALSAVRRERGLTQEDVAFGSGVSLRHYQQLESGHMNPTFKTLLQISKIVGIKVSELVKKIEK
jgi:transcriptional regulator with XRE-family HTH domain